MRGDQVCTEALASASRGPAAWARLLEPADFFRQFKNYLQVPLQWRIHMPWRQAHAALSAGHHSCEAAACPPCLVVQQTDSHTASSMCVSLRCRVMVALTLNPTPEAACRAQIEVWASSEEDFRAWDGWVHSRLRQLVLRVELFVLVRPWPKARVLAGLCRGVGSG